MKIYIVLQDNGDFAEALKAFYLLEDAEKFRKKCEEDETEDIFGYSVDELELV